MLEIFNGREKFYQWDVNQKLIVDDDIIAVQYDNGTGDALVCGVYEYNGVKVADVPNIMLQTYWAIHAYAYCGECVRGDKVIEVEKRSRPDDYVYTETETLRYSTLYERVKTLEEQHIEEVASVAAQLEEANSRIDELEQRPTGGGVKDWNENNPDSPAYIANRTHYEVSGIYEVMAESRPDMIEDGQAIFMKPAMLNEGMEYTITYNGVPYQVRARLLDMEGIQFVACGNINAIFGDEPTVEPFALIDYGEMAAEAGLGIVVIMMDGAADLTLKIECNGYIKKIDSKYLNMANYYTKLETQEIAKEYAKSLYIIKILIRNTGSSLEGSFEDIEAAFAAGKVVMCNYRDEKRNIYSILTATDYKPGDSVVFTAHTGGSIYKLTYDGQNVPTITEMIIGG